MLFGLTFDIFKELGNVFNAWPFFVLAKLVADCTNKSCKFLNPIFLRLVVDTVEKDQVLFWHFFCKLCYKSCDLTIGKEHKLLDKLHGLKSCFASDFKRFARVIELELHLIIAKVYSTFMLTPLAQHSCELAQPTTLFDIRGSSRSEYLLRLFVGKTLLRADDG